jgi:alpha-N-arabinofuranosidase
VKYLNPILQGFYPDPSICRVGQDYYLVTSSFEYFPGVPIFHSKDLVNWEQIGHCLTRESQLPLKGVNPSGGIWAPTIRYHNGIFYMTTTNINGRGNFYVTAEDPAGEWSEPIWLSIGGIDPSFTFDEDKVYYTISHPDANGSWGIAQAEIDISTGKFTSELKHIWKGSGGKSPEAPHLYKIGDWYYLMIAEGGTFFTHMVTIARCRTPWGPFESCPRNPILTNMQAKNLEIHCTGHGDLVKDHMGNWWIIFHGIQIAQKYMTHIGRETFLAPVSWDELGWAVVNNGKCIERKSEASLLPCVSMKAEAEIDHFDDNTLGFHWNYLRNPYIEDYDLNYKKGSMTLWGNSYEINDLDSPALLCRRQRYYECMIATSFEYQPTHENEEAGLIIFITGEFYYKVVKKKINSRYKLTLEKRADDFFQIVASVEVKDGAIYIKVEADRLQYRFYYGYTEEEKILLGSASTRFLACEVVGRGFTGTYTGIYASGKGKKSTAPACFDYFILKNQEKNI